MSRAAARERVLDALQAAGPYGCTTEELAQPRIGGLRFGGRIHELKKRWDIETQRRAGTECCRYVLKGKRQDADEEKLLLIGTLPSGVEFWEVCR